MKLVVLIPSDAHAGSAGVRIRYARLVAPLSRIGIELDTMPIDSFDPVKTTCDAAVICKCHDARALVVAALLSRRKIPVGLDLFDDYFSQADDSRLARFRSWLAQASHLVTFMLCSTESMANAVRSYAGDVPLHILSDPAPAFDQRALADDLARRMAVIRSEGILRVCWFGIGDNPYFPVGLSDVLAFSAELRSLASGDSPIEFTIMTNSRALDASGLSTIARLPLATRVEQWSLEGEEHLLRRSMLAFLPVNGQPFSTAKSLNRAVTALTSGCQVLSVGYALYSALDAFIYRHPRNLLRDIARERLKLSPSTVRGFALKLDEIASPEREAGSLAQFVREVSSRSSARMDHPSEPICVLHGFGTSASVNHLVARGSGISVRTPLCSAPLECDVLVNLASGGEQALLVSDRARARLSALWRKRAASKQRIGGRRFWKIESPGRPISDPQAGSPSLALQLARYGSVMHRLIDMLPRLFGRGQTIISESSPLPVEVR